MILMRTAGTGFARMLASACVALPCLAALLLLTSGCAEAEQGQVATVTVMQPVTVTVTTTGITAVTSVEPAPLPPRVEPPKLAEAATVELADFPAGWRPTSDSTAEDFEGTGSCGDQSEAPLAGREGRWFETTDADWLFKSWGWVYDSDATAERVFQAQAEDGFLSCLGASLIPDPGTGWEFSGRVDGDLSFDPVPAADGQVAYEIELPGTTRLLIDLVLLRIDRTLVVVALWGYDDNPPRDLHHDLAVTVAERASRTA